MISNFDMYVFLKIISKCLEGCEEPEWQGDGYCDDENNVAACHWDGGDCCNNDVPDYDNFCLECQCLGPNFDSELSDFSTSVLSTNPKEQPRGKHFFLNFSSRFINCFSNLKDN